MSRPVPSARVRYDNLRNAASFGPYLVCTYTYYDGDIAKGSYEVLRDGERVYAQTGIRFTIGGQGTDPNPLIVIGKDITGNGVPNLVVRQFMGSAHRDELYYVFEIGDEFRKLAVITASGGGFRKLDEDANLEFVTYDNTFAYFDGYSYADCPRPRVVLRYREGGYLLACDQMVSAAPAAETLADLASRMRVDPWWSQGRAPPTLVRQVVDLIYAGQAQSGWKLLDLSWPRQLAGKDRCRHKLVTALRASPYWPQLRCLQTGGGVEERANAE